MGRAGNDLPQYVRAPSPRAARSMPLEGDLNLIGQDWHWDVNYVYGAALFRTHVNETNNERFYNAIDAVKDSNGKIVCRVTLTDPTRLPGCIPMDILGAALSRKRRSTIPVAMRVIRPTTRPDHPGQFPWHPDRSAGRSADLRDGRRKPLHQPEPDE